MAKTQQVTKRKPRGSGMRKHHGETMNQLVFGKKVQYEQAFVLAVLAMAMRRTNQEASDYYDVPVRTIEDWRAAANKADAEQLKQATTRSGRNPYRGTPYSIEKRLRLSDKLFAELEYTIEVEKEQHGYIKADVLQKLIVGYSILTDKRRLEEGAHTALISAFQDPQDIFEEGEAKVVEFRKRYALGSGE